MLPIEKSVPFSRDRFTWSIIPWQLRAEDIVGGFRLEKIRLEVGGRGNIKTAKASGKGAVSLQYVALFYKA
jgi:hypothetical protein